MNNRLLHAQNIVPVHPVEYILSENLDTLPELPMVDNGDGTYYCGGTVVSETLLNTYTSGQYKAKINDKWYKLTLQNDLRKTQDEADRLIIDPRECRMWLEENISDNPLYILKVTGGTITHVNDSVYTGNNNGFEKGTKIKVKADTPESGQHFAGWLLGGESNIAGMGAIHEFFVNHNTSLQATYTTEVKEVAPAVVMSQAIRFRNTQTGKDNVRIEITFDVPAGFTAVNEGILRTYDDSLRNDLYIGKAGVTNNASSQIARSGTYTYFFNIGNTSVNLAKNIHTVGYLIYKDAQGTQHTIYTDTTTLSVPPQQSFCDLKSVSQGDFEITGTVNHTVDVLRVYGISTQETTVQGKNLLDMDSWTLFAKQDDIYVTDVPNIRNVINVNLPQGNYVLSYDIKSEVGANSRLQINFSDGTVYIEYAFSTGDFVHLEHAVTNKAINSIALGYSTGRRTELKNVMLNKGDIALPYEPYIPDSPSPAYPRQIKSVEDKVHSHGYNLFDKKLWNIGKGTSCAGAGYEYQIVSGKFTVATIDLKPGQKYTFTINNDTYWLNRIIEADKHGICTLNHDFYRDISRSKDRYTWTTNNKTTHAVFSFRMRDESAVTQNDVEAVKFMLMEGDELRQFERYRGSTITLPVLRSLPDGTRDVLTIDRAQKRAWVERHISTSILNGNEAWTLPTGKVEGYSSYRLSHFFGVNGKVFTSSHFLCYTDNFYTNDPVANKMTSYPGTVQLIVLVDNHIADSKEQTEIEAWKQYLTEQYNAGTPVTVQYALAEPITEEIPWTDDLLLLTNQYYTSITADSNLAPDVEVQAKILGNR